MINKATNGFLSVLGALPVQFAMLLAFLATVSIPRDAAGKKDADDSIIYHWVWIMHLVQFVTIALNHYESLGVAKHTVNAAVMLLQVVFLINIFVGWIPLPEAKEAAAE